MARSKRARDGADSRPAPSRKARRPFRRLLGFVAKWTAVAAVWGVIAAGGLTAWYAADLPDVDAALAATRQPTVTLIAADGSMLATIGDIYGVPVSLADLPPALPRAVLATEDRRFYGHFGIDPIGLARAAYVNIRAGRIVQGGSTITQQVAKNLFLSPERSLKRKVQEVVLALWLESRFSKDQILTLYLNRVYLGAGTYGVDAASRRYFGHPARQLTTYEAAMLAGLLKAPSRFNPTTDHGKAEARADIVLANMVDAGYLTAAQAGKARAAKSRRLAAAGAGGRSGRHFADWVLDQVSGYVSPGDRDIVVLTTLDPRLQRLAEHGIADTLAAAGRQFDVGEAALVAMAPDGAVRAMVGGRDYDESQFNRATQALRQPGSAFKPIVYLAALEAGLSPQTRLSAAPVTVDGWTPRNFEGGASGEVSLAEALARSINTVAVRVGERAGYAHVVETARRLGITSELEATPSLSLGAGEVTLTELTGAYAAFANGGRGVWPYGIREIRDSRGNILYRRSGSGPGQVATERHVLSLDRMLARVVAEGTGRAAALDRPAAGKTGTSQSFRDAWFIGFTADLVAGVWMGNDDGRPMRQVTGGGLPARAWRAFMAAAHEGVPVRPLPGGGPEPGPEQGFWSRLFTPLGGEG